MQLDGNDDEILMARIASGNQLAFASLVERYTNRAYAAAWRILNGSADAEDVVQEVFTRLWVHAPSWDAGKAKFSTWFYRILLNACIDHKRKRVNLPLDVIDEPQDATPSIEQRLVQDQLALHVAAQVHALPERQRLAILLCYFEGLSNQEAAEIMQLHIKALEALLVRARKTLHLTLASLMQNEREAV